MGLDKDETVRAPISMAGLARTDPAANLPAALSEASAGAALFSGRGHAVDSTPEPPAPARPSVGVETILGGDRADDGKQP